MRTSRRSRCSKRLWILTIVSLMGASGDLVAQEDQAVIDDTVLGTLAPEDTDEPLQGFYNTADLSIVITGGNSSATTLGLRNLAEYYWTSSSLRFDLGGLRTDARSRDDRVAIGTGQDDFFVEEAERQRTAENYFANLRYDHDLSERWYLFGIGGWDRNQFAGFDSRWQGALGRMQVVPDGSTTLLVGPIGDQNTLRGVLAEIRWLNLPLISILRRDVLRESESPVG